LTTGKVKFADHGLPLVEAVHGFHGLGGDASTTLIYPKPNIEVSMIAGFAMVVNINMQDM